MKSQMMMCRTGTDHLKDLVRLCLLVALGLGVPASMAYAQANFTPDQDAAAEMRLRAKAMGVPTTQRSPIEAEIVRMQPGTRYCAMNVGTTAPPAANAPRHMGRTENNTIVTASPVLVCN